ncbi:MAG: N-acetylmuramoyl-L-alanine amidase [Chitinophagaceae bacterium]|nr:N-acetylmuramoyl-L-alanine amidase [Chitinophagaceae bacterium]
MIRLSLIIGFLGFFLGKTTGALPYLEYGLGSDRLGGAKMTYLDTNIVVKVIDSTIGNYKIQLSKDHLAYLPKTNFKKDSTIKLQPYYLTSSWMVNGDDKYDYVVVTLDEKLPYKSMQQINPSKIVLDVFGATSNTNWITQRSSAKEIKNVYHEQIEDDVFRIIIELKHGQHWGYSVYYQNNKLVIKVKRQPEDLSLDKMKIAVDAGHGGDNNGASGVSTGILEKKYTLLIAKQLERVLLDKEARVFMTRTKDTAIGMVERTEMLKKEDPDFLISIHLNSSVKDSISGVSTYYRYIGFRPLTQYIQESMVKIGLKDFGNIGSFNFSLSGPTEYPNCLVEVAFLSNKEDEQLILDPEFHKAVATQIVDGIKEWLKSCKKGDD